MTDDRAESILDVFDLNRPLDEYSPELRVLAIKIRKIVLRVLGADDPVPDP